MNNEFDVVKKTNYYTLKDLDLENEYKQMENPNEEIDGRIYTSERIILNFERVESSYLPLLETTGDYRIECFLTLYRAISDIRDKENRQSRNIKIYRIVESYAIDAETKEYVFVYHLRYISVAMTFTEQESDGSYLYYITRNPDTKSINYKRIVILNNVSPEENLKVRKDIEEKDPNFLFWMDSREGEEWAKWCKRDRINQENTIAIYEYMSKRFDDDEK